MPSMTSRARANGFPIFDTMVPSHFMKDQIYQLFLRNGTNYRKSYIIVYTSLQSGGSFLHYFAYFMGWWIFFFHSPSELTEVRTVAKWYVVIAVCERQPTSDRW